ncbi:nucleoside recognition domain-containing protein [Rubrivirga sp. S365]|uniref:Nucleoside recognition domain-containing protein n=1 Tax=Rubrivirga litoralis TaxID=3075598 RepID=A0ABU3BQE3_9BACT|nr:MULTISPECIES: nucleoside recognition domain-containing protein [unclassified Rubrivirga]MDT0631511.1 nucleoside recognition domain-containing protein [Rubrivirga sp. F394]MDT7855506.1 nucleoside recognition domain-containing protein [Rubrivirga sp. S365]
MLNYIWAGLIIVSLVFALAADVGDLARDTYRNGQALPVTVAFPAGYDADAARQPALLRIDADAFRQFYGAEGAPEAEYPATFRRTDAGFEIRLDDADAPLPAPLDVIRDATNPSDNVLQGTLGPTLKLGRENAYTAPPAPNPPTPQPVQSFDPGMEVVSTGLTFAPVRFVKLGDITQAALDFAETAVTIAIGLVGVLVLFLGLLKIAEDAGIVRAVVRLVRPVLGPLFPDIPRDHPAMGMIALNLAANVFGLGNAATPFGIKAMEELQKLNPEPETATDSMVMLLALNTASVQLIPPLTLIAIIGIETNAVYFPILFTTMGSLAVAIIAAKTLGRLRRYRETDPLRHGLRAPDAAPPAAGGGVA